jgi:cysteine desulfurase/selenocysteine lyase
MKVNLQTKVLRQAFPFLDHMPHQVYLDSAATTQKPKVVLDALRASYETAYANVHRGGHQLSKQATVAFEETRAKVRSFLNLSSVQQVILTHGATESINLVAYGLTHEFKKGDLIVLDQAAHHANWLPWQVLAQKTGAELVVAPILTSGCIDEVAFAELLKRQPKLVALTHVSNVLGSCNPVQKLTAMAKQVGALVLIDGAQAVAHFDVDVRSMGCDYYVFSSHKMYGPSGVGVLAGTLDALERLEPLLTGGEMVAQVELTQSQYQPLPARLEAGTPAIAEVVGFGAAITWLQSLDRSYFLEAEKKLLKQAWNRLKTMEGVVLYSAQDAVGVIAFNIESEHHSDVATLLDDQGIMMRSGHHCAQPLIQSLGISGCCRLSIGLYTDAQDVNQALDAVEFVRDFLANV